MTFEITGFAVFWLFIILYLVVDTWLFLKGYDTVLWNHRTPEEKEIQRIKIDRMK